MKLLNIPLSERKKDLTILLLLIWIIFSFNLLHSQVRDSREVLPKLLALNLEQKNELIDGNFYKFMMLCKKRIPPGEDVLFKSVPPALPLRSREWYRKEYLIGKSPYYLYPCKIYRVEYAVPGIKYEITYDASSSSFHLGYNQK